MAALELLPGTRRPPQAGARDPRGRRQRGGRGRRARARLVRRRDGDDRAARRRARDLLGRGVADGAEPRLLLRRALRRGRRAASSSRCRSARSSSTTRSGRRRSPCPGVPAGLGALHERFGRLPWRDLFEPALRLARGGVEMPPAHASCLAMLAPVMTMDAGARIYAPDGMLLQAGDAAAAARAREGARAPRRRGRRVGYAGSLAAGDPVADAGARRARHRATISRAYEAVWSEPRRDRRTSARGCCTRGGLVGLPDLLPGCRGSRGLTRPSACSPSLAALEVRGPETHTTNVTVVDARGTPASSRRASASAPATSCPGSTCT